LRLQEFGGSLSGLSFAHPSSLYTWSITLIRALALGSETGVDVMFFLAATGKIDPDSVRIGNGCAIFTLQVDRLNYYRVKACGLEQCDLIESICPGEPIFLLGTAEGRRKVTITPWLILRIYDGNHHELLQIARQLLESQTLTNRFDVL
jgi:hypothetical protein